MPHPWGIFLMQPPTQGWGLGGDLYPSSGVVKLAAPLCFPKHTKHTKPFFSLSAIFTKAPPLGEIFESIPGVVSPASLLDSQHGCIASPRSLVKLGWQFGLALSANVVALSAKMNKSTPHNNQIHFLVQEIPGPVETKPPTEFDQTPSSRVVMQYTRAVNQGGWLARLGWGGGGGFY